MNKIIKKTINIILIIIIIFLSIYALLRVTNKVEIYKVETGSMEDNIHAGDYILILKKSNYKKGDVVTYTANGYYVTHRIVKENDDKVITKGDANNKEDEEISKKEIIGKVIFNGGVLNFVIKFKYVLVLLLLSIYLFTYYFDSCKNEKNKRKE